MLEFHILRTASKQAKKHNKQRDTEAAGEMAITSSCCSKKTLANYTNAKEKGEV